ncbi:sporulation histidine kinase inhibitor Sda [Aquibacillus koreensis]|uniref:Sporulation histidine kinase inhibitor Sda n=1 Tax=Aquibacillus koreensis TaxID=279446 RepID=A0A9X3WR15_9BACI|nr:sporulation histidine kinase inhibitor Sda [Aquibacillus koreensis]MCT2534467.1 sporulation histidine kinase inhibitor Sda [Aquibacillus koreensis]MDC3421774.1 sporulation histidine kinase inhibitor Sda [Aquibacillus koreensis]
MNFISDRLLVELYVKAVTLEYSDEIITHLEKEIKLREISLEEVLNCGEHGY